MAKRRKPTKRSAPKKTPVKRTYRSVTGRFISKEAWKAQQRLQKQAKAERKPVKEVWKELPDPRTNRRNALGRKVKADDASFGKTTPTTFKDRRNKQRKTKARQALDKGKLPKYDRADDSNFHKERGEIIQQKYRAYIWRFTSIEVARDTLSLLANRYNRNELRARLSIGSGLGRKSQWVGSPFGYAEDAIQYSFKWDETKSGEQLFQAALDDEGQLNLWYEVEVLLKQDIDKKLF